ncbi:helix-hairpin-helix domain-containing protein [Staphylospora marina]|uniref:helix-hairpin-helix domain-containing protein n=1 Tax=Staphylospora marina TaxID=2490858 RepID=UPI0013DE3313|nr:helix-hairpin-helix domain-containing protein [Staphylospora marina]
MLDLDWTPREKRWAVLSLCLAAVLVGGWVWDWLGKEEPVPPATAYVAPATEAKPGEDSDAGEKEKEIVVDVKGAVKHPGLYRLKEGARVWDAVRMAGGAREEADLNRVNLAEPLSDGISVRIPRKGEEVMASESASAMTVNGSAGKISINTATAEELERLEGIGPSKARAIIRYREEHGPFRSMDEIAEVPGIGEKTLEKFRHQIRL